ncbi:MAG: PKD domain-containing protein [Thermoplasmatota archaeon]
MPSPICGTLEIAFDASASHDVDGTVASWHWDFGDGWSAEGPQVTHEYATPGAYDAVLTVADDAGLTAATATRFVLADCPPLVLDDLAIAATAGEAVHACMQTRGGQGGPYAYQAAAVGDRSLAGTPLAMFTSGCLDWVPSAAGESCIQVTASDPTGSDTACLKVTVTARPRDPIVPPPPQQDLPVTAPLSDAASPIVKAPDAPAQPASTAATGTSAWWLLLLLVLPALALGFVLGRRRRQS